MSRLVVLLLGLTAACTGAILKAGPERVKSVSTKTDDCFQCGMIEGLGYINLKVSAVHYSGYMYFPTY